MCTAGLTTISTVSYGILLAGVIWSQAFLFISIEILTALLYITGIRYAVSLDMAVSNVKDKYADFVVDATQAVSLAFGEC